MAVQAMVVVVVVQALVAAVEVMLAVAAVVVAVTAAVAVAVADNRDWNGIQRDIFTCTPSGEFSNVSQMSLSAMLPLGA